RHTRLQVQTCALPISAPLSIAATRRFGFPIAGLILGVFISATYLYTLYRTDHTVLSSEDLVGLNLPLLGRVPELHSTSWLNRVPIGRASCRRSDVSPP